MQPKATARLRRPSAAREFYLRINLGPVQFQAQGPIQMEVLLNGRSLGLRTYDKADWIERRWTIPTETPENVEVTLRAPRPFSGIEWPVMAHLEKF